MTRVAVIGSGAMGLAAAYHAVRAGHDVTVYEADDRPGGMAAHFDFDGLSIERYYHFICKADQAHFDLLRELGIADRLRWRDTSMGYYIDGRHYDWGDPLSLLRFDRLGLLERLRYGARMFLATRRQDWQPLEQRRASEWLTSELGQRTYDLLWRRLFELKFHQYTDNISAAWIWTRIKRVGTSRRSVFQEQLGYLEGGSETLVTALVEAIRSGGGRILLSSPVREVEVAGERVTGVRTDAGSEPYDAVISTAPVPLVPEMVPALPEEWKRRYRAITNIGVACVLLKLKRRVTRHFWLNVNDPAMEIPGIVEFSNLRPVQDHLVYIPYYMPVDHPKFGWDDDRFVDETFGYLCRINPALQQGDLLGSFVGRMRHAQPVCEPGFANKLPPVRTPIAGLQVADTCFYYPEDRGISESVRYGRMMAEALPPGP
ncbi:MAG TPA: NAD(P)/FAD-dependent oxidoreductase [Sedimenticola thiotaurini]|uniref:NAD(P)/FAD-dependent oxidoreductase n=1 Tax=Sedimenticola thiotaurini TaxID=1543721 RepID=A0A831RP25_9GAMM|nr:NAD(P)/FAD-dependent oxidoreductase [Sedimenticola thiotaurini]